MPVPRNAGNVLYISLSLIWLYDTHKCLSISKSFCLGVVESIEFIIHRIKNQILVLYLCKKANMVRFVF